MNSKENGNSDSPQGPYYIPSHYAQNVRRYRQVHPPGDPLLYVQAFDYLLISLLQITRICPPGLEILSVHIDHALPLVASVEDTPEFFSRAPYPLRLGPEESLSLLLNNHATSDRFNPLGCPPPKPKKVVVTTNLGLLIFEPELDGTIWAQSPRTLTSPVQITRAEPSAHRTRRPPSGSSPSATAS